MILILIVWVVCAFVCAFMASSRNRSPGLWFVLGLFFGLIAVLILAVIGPDEHAVTHQAVPSSPLASASTSFIPATEEPRSVAPASLPQRYDRRRWQILVEVDPEIADAAAIVREFGNSYEDELAEKFLALNDKTYLNAIVDRLRADAATKISERDQLTRQAGEAAATNLMSLRDILAGNDNVDKVTGQRVRSTEIYSGPALSFSGGVLIEFEDGAAEIRSGGLRRPFKNRTEALAWG